MAIRPCPECRANISDKAPFCPQCGTPIASLKLSQKSLPRRMGDAFALFIFIGIFLFIVFHSGKDEKPDSGAQKETLAAEQAGITKKKEEEANCRATLSCYAQKHYVAAGIYCKEEIEKLAKYEMKWTDGFLEMKFNHAKWLNKEAGTLTFSGDKAMFQNGFGAFKKVQYECDLDPITHSVLDVRVIDGN